MKKTNILPNEHEQALLEGIRIVSVQDARTRRRCNRLLDEHHYLGSLAAVGEQRWYIAQDASGDWVGVLVFTAACKHLRARDAWIGWAPDQRRKRLAELANNARFCLLKKTPNLATRVMGLTLARLSEDWERKYGHPVLAVETFVDPEQFNGGCYRAGGWQEVGQTSGYGRCQRDYYVKHDKPKRLFVRELVRGACRSLRAEHLKPALAGVEQKVPVVSAVGAAGLRCLVGYLKQVPDFRDRIGRYPIWSLLGIVACAHLSGAPRGQKDLAAFARRLTMAQRRALGIRRDRDGAYPAPSQPTFSRLLGHVDALKVEEAILAFQKQVRGECPKQELINMDGKHLKHSQGQQILTAVSARTLHYLGSRPVTGKTNEIPIAQDLLPHMDLEDRRVSLDALHTQDETARQLVQEAGADYFLTVKKNRLTQHEDIRQLMQPAPAGFSP